MKARYLGLFAALLVLPAEAIQATGSIASPAIDVDVLVRPIARGERISPVDFMPAALPQAEARGALRAADVTEVEALRPLTAGRVVRASDIQPVQLVRRGEPVSIEMRSGALMIAAAGRALGNGRQGDPVRVFSTSTGRTIDAVVGGPGKVLVRLP